MFTISADSSKLVKSVQNDYRKAAEEYRQTRHIAENRRRLNPMVRVAVALSGLVFAGMSLLQFATG
jgi:uncharacterized membrane protein YjjP (DUF1212 family)